MGAPGAREGGQGATPGCAEPWQARDTTLVCCEVSVLAVKENGGSLTWSPAPSKARLTGGAGEASPTLAAGRPGDVRAILFENASLAFRQGTRTGEVKCTNTVKRCVLLGSKCMGNPEASGRARPTSNKVYAVKLLGDINVLIPDLNINIMEEHKSSIPESTGSLVQHSVLAKDPETSSKFFTSPRPLSTS